MKKFFLILFFFQLVVMKLDAQAPHLFDYEYDMITEENHVVREMINKVSVDSLYMNIDELSSFYTRRADSRYIFQVRDRLVDRYSQYNIDTVFQHDFNFFIDSTLVSTAPNVIAMKKGILYPNEYVLCGAHYDSYNKAEGHPDSLRSPGADDNATGVAGILETARILSDYTFARSILFCNFNAEEFGLIGSAAFAADCAKDSLKIMAYFNLDMSGYLEEDNDIEVHLLYTERDSILADFYFSMCDVYFPELPVYHRWLTWGDSDYSSFNRNGYPALHPFENVRHSSPYIHTENDIIGLSVNNLEQSKIYTQLNLAAVASLAIPTKVAVDEFDEVSAMRIIPNPASDYFTLNVDVETLEIFDLMGRRLFVKDEVKKTEQIDISTFNKGMLIIRIDGIHWIKLMKR